MLIEASILPESAGERARAQPKASALVGPHAVIHAARVMQERLSTTEYAAILARAQISKLPSGKEMVPETEALRLHRWLAFAQPIVCFDIAKEAARRTADYIIANRIPGLIVKLLKALPPELAAPLLMASIRKHAWTFIGAGEFKPQGAFAFGIDRSHAGDPVPPPESLFVWYGCVFEQLYKRLVAPTYRCVMQPAGPAELMTRQYRLVRS